MSRKGLTQCEIDHMENLTVRDEHWDDGNYWDEGEEFEDDDIDDFD